MKLYIILLILLFIYLLKKRKQEGFTPVDALISEKDKKSIIVLFKKVVDLFHKHNIEYWAIGGTILGCIRDKGLIPWDDDADVAVMKENFPKILKLKEELNKNNMDIVEWFGGLKIYDKGGREIEGKNFKFPFIDIFHIVKKDGIYLFADDLSNDLWPKEKYSYDDIFPLKLYDYEDYKIYGPNKAIKMIDKIYPNWKNEVIKTNDHTVHKPVDIKFKIEYNLNKKPYMWLYWDNKEPDIIKLCYETVLKHCSKSFDIVRLNKDNIEKYIPEVKEYKNEIEKLKIAHKVDIYRIMLLYKYGGVYLDSDIVVLRDPIEIMSKLKKYDFVGFGCTGGSCKNGYGNPSNWILASRPNTNLMANILTKQLKIIKNNIDYNKEDYHIIGKNLIWDELENLINNEDYEYYHYPNTIDGTRDINGHWVTTERLFSNEKIKYDNENNMMFVVYYNSSQLNTGKLTRDEILKNDWNISKFIKRSLNIKN